MSIDDRKIKNIDVRVKDASGNVRTINLIEHDTVDLKYRDSEIGKVVHIETGEIIKIGVVNGKNPYLVIVSYNYYLDKNLFHVPVSSLTQIINVNHSSEQYTMTPVYSSDESVALLRSVGNCLEFTLNGKDWIPCGGGGGGGITIDDVDREIDKKVDEYHLTNADQVEHIVDQATADFLTESQIGQKISDATADFVTEDTVTTIVDEKVAEATADFVTGEQVDQKIETATADFVTESDVTHIVDQATADFLTESQITQKIEDATADFITEEAAGALIDEKVAEATADFITEEAAGELIDTKVAEATADFVTESDVTHIVDQATADFLTESQIDSKIADATADFITEEAASTLIDEKVAEATADFITEEAADELIDQKIETATADFITEDEAVEIVDQATAEFLTETQIDAKIENATADFVTGVQVDEKIETATADFITGAEADQKISDATADFITGAQADEKIATATAEFITAADAQEQIDISLEPYATLASPTFTGDVKVPTLAQTANDERVASTSYVRTAISDLSQEFAGAFHFRGIVDTEEDLANIENPGEGDVYQVRQSSAGENAEFAYNGSEWVELGTVIDLADYPTTEEVTNMVNEGVATANAYTDEQVTAIDPYLLCKEKGYEGTKDDFYTALAEILNSMNTIVINDDLTAE